ncbi:MAG: 5-formyltetrahydrofolate cyclo-ligase [Coriobacteriia bacterium]|jgi:5-formyltetrahydrofolate cyclo-ligase|nr:5-formyltetrahydrofolate cyclo-ligase [Coriobacteriia bacterium]
MSAEHVPSKEAARALGRSARQAVRATDRALYAAAAAQRLLALPEIVRARVVLAYAATPEEIDPAPVVDALRRRGVTVALPRVAGREELTVQRVDANMPLVRSKFGIIEPPADAPEISPANIDVAIVPGVAFDESCQRVGHGIGYYDRLLARMPHATAVGLAFDSQVLAEVPSEEHDVSLDVLVTPTRTIRHEQP